MAKWEFNVSDNALTYEFKPDYEVCVLLKTVSRKVDIDEAIRCAEELGINDYDAKMDLKNKLYMYAN